MKARFVGTGELAQLWGVSRQRAAVLASSHDFPAPFERLLTGRIWLYGEVIAWSLSHERTLKPLPDYPNPTEV